MRGTNGARWWPRILSYSGYSPVSTSDRHKFIGVSLKFVWCLKKRIFASEFLGLINFHFYLYCSLHLIFLIGKYVLSELQYKFVKEFNHYDLSNLKRLTHPNIDFSSPSRYRQLSTLWTSLFIMIFVLEFCQKSLSYTSCMIFRKM